MATIKGLHADLIVENLKSTLKKKNYAFFDNNKPYNVNIIGCRSKQTKVNEFDDCLFLIYRDDNKDWIVHSYQITTDIGIRYLKSPINKDGAAILVAAHQRAAQHHKEHRWEHRSGAFHMCQCVEQHLIGQPPKRACKRPQRITTSNFYHRLALYYARPLSGPMDELKHTPSRSPQTK